MPTSKWLFLKNLRSKTLGQIQNLVPHRLFALVSEVIENAKKKARRLLYIKGVERSRYAESMSGGRER
jgi:hypothetical protein